MLHAVNQGNISSATYENVGSAPIVLLGKCAVIQNVVLLADCGFNQQKIIGFTLKSRHIFFFEFFSERCQMIRFSLNQKENLPVFILVFRQ